MWKICSRSFAIIRHMWSSTIETGLSATSLSCTLIQGSVIFHATRVSSFVIYKAFSFTWPTSKPIYWNKRKHLDKNRVQLTVDLFGTQWNGSHVCFGTPIWPRWRHVKTLYWLFWRCIWDWVCVVSKSTVGMFWNEFPFPASWQPIKEAVASVQTSTSFRPSFYRNLKMANYPSNIFYGEDLTLSLPECFIEFCEVTLTFEYVDKNPWCDHSNESSLPVFTHGAICLSKF